MGDKEKTIVEAVGKLPAAVQEKFLDQITGAAIAIEVSKQQQADRKEQA